MLTELRLDTPEKRRRKEKNQEVSDVDIKFPETIESDPYITIGKVFVRVKSGCEIVNAIWGEKSCDENDTLGKKNNDDVTISYNK